jgi:hypothetical protein
MKIKKKQVNILMLNIGNSTDKKRSVKTVYWNKMGNLYLLISINLQSITLKIKSLKTNNFNR